MGKLIAKIKTSVIKETQRRLGNTLGGNRVYPKFPLFIIGYLLVKQ